MLKEETMHVLISTRTDHVLKLTDQSVHQLLCLCVSYVYIYNVYIIYHIPLVLYEMKIIEYSLRYIHIKD